MPARRTYQRRARSARRRTMWTGATTYTISPTVGPNTLLSLQFALPVTDLAGVTLLTIVGRIDGFSATDDASRFETAAGFIVHNSLLTVGSLNLQDMAASWLWQAPMTAPLGLGTSEIATNKAIRHELRIRAKRRFRSNEERLHLLIENFDGAETLNYSYNLRFLWALP